MLLQYGLFPLLGLAHGFQILGGYEAVEALRPRIPSRPSNNFISEMTRREPEPNIFERATDVSSKNMRCGYVNGTCPTGYCCSIGGFCGQDFHYCSGPACQLDYGDKCDGNVSPEGEPTKDVARPHIGNLSYGGAGIYYCTNKSHVALTFDDGPYIYTEMILDVLDKYDAKATFFITGNNMGKGQIDNVSTGYPQLIQRMHKSGHQIASHTWTHQNLTNMTTEQKHNQMYYNEMAFRNILGFFPTYMRPPYSECDNATQDMLSDMGYHIVYYNIDSQDYENDSPELIHNSEAAINEQFATVNVTAGYPADFIIINHDIHNQTAHVLTAWTLDRMLSLGYGTSITVGECMGDPPENWYRSASGAPSDAPVHQSALPSVTPTAIPSSGPSPTLCKGTATASCTMAAAGVRIDINLALAGLGLVFAIFQAM